MYHTKISILRAFVFRLSVSFLSGRSERHTYRRSCLHENPCRGLCFCSVLADSAFHSLPRLEFSSSLLVSTEPCICPADCHGPSCQSRVTPLAVISAGYI